MANELGNLPDLSGVGSKTSSSVVDLLKPFTSSNKDVFIFKNKSVNVRREFTDKILTILNDATLIPHDCAVIKECLSALAIMSRDSSSVQGSFNSKTSWNNLTSLAGLKAMNGELKSGCLDSNQDIDVLCLKCLSNMLYLTQDSNRFCDDAEFLRLVIYKLSNWSQLTVDLEFLLVRLLFLITAFNTNARSTIVHKHHGRRVLCNMLAAKLSQCLETDTKSPTFRAILLKQQAKPCCEIFKTVFNLNMKLEHAKLSEDIVEESEDVISICRKFLLVKIKDDDNYTERFHTDVENCLYSVALLNFNDVCFTPEICHTDDGEMFSYCNPDLPVIENRDISAVQVILNHLEVKLNDRNMPTESLVPVLSLLSVMSRSSRVVRKYCKKCIIPPKKDFADRPELGSELKNKLIKLFTHVNTEIKGAAADFIFVLCKENVDKLVKHTGYGNAAGLLASRGLLAGGKGSSLYSDTDSDSDTEEYRKNFEKINPVTGHIPPEMPDPMENMSEEQKEYLAVQLANELTKLSNNSVIKPVCVDPNTGELVSFQQKVHETVLPKEKNSDEEDSD